MRARWNTARDRARPSKAVFLVGGVVLLYCFRTPLGFTQHSTKASQTVSPRDTFSHVSSMKDALRTLLPHTVPNTAGKFRRILSRELVGITYDMFPEQYFSTHMLPRITGKATFLDIGANVGQFAIPIAKSGHRVVSIEPHPKTCETLKQNVLAASSSSLVNSLLCLTRQ